jgi:subfamily B ATP-binding cassette protein MsbA
MIIPFLEVLFKQQELVTEPMAFEFSMGYFRHTLNYYMGLMMTSRGEAGALGLVSILVVVFSLLKNGFLYAANFVLAPIRAFVVRDIRNDVYKKVLRLPLSFYTEARKGDVISLMSSDVQEIEMSLLTSIPLPS